ncbi:hypothetical protein [Phycicoccus flavus]|uniref:hypothetical protein n=1 Tax=Phycicoccus flavus TaxID=2502783 RepID=UPI000FEB6C83|nr:hypothetical protein [Phycicoccus flavus]NHA67439.1 hypothetical protein [Phycicoccus flavus]
MTAGPDATPVGAAPAGRGVLVTRVVLGAAGLLVLGYGLVLLLGSGTQQLLAVATWLVGGVVLHDAVIAPVVVGLGVLAAARVPDRLRTPLVGLLVVLGPLTLAAVPVLGRYGARPDNPTLLDRPYWAGYLAIVVLALLAVAAWTARRRPSAGPAGPGDDAAR